MKRAMLIFISSILVTGCTDKKINLSYSHPTKNNQQFYADKLECQTYIANAFQSNNNQPIYTPPRAPSSYNYTLEKNTFANGYHGTISENSSSSSSFSNNLYNAYSTNMYIYQEEKKHDACLDCLRAKDYQITSTEETVFDSEGTLLIAVGIAGLYALYSIGSK